MIASFEIINATAGDDVRTAHRRGEIGESSESGQRSVDHIRGKGLRGKEPTTGERNTPVAEQVGKI